MSRPLRLPLRVYVAGASAEPERVRWAMDALRELGCEVYDWRVGYRPTEELTREERAAAARADLAAMDGADFIWCLAPAGRSDCLVELGYAVAWAGLGTRVLVSGPVTSRGIFAALLEEHDEDEHALGEIAGMVWAVAAVGGR